MMRLERKRSTVDVVDDQWGQPLVQEWIRPISLGEEIGSSLSPALPQHGRELRQVDPVRAGEVAKGLSNHSRMRGGAIG